MVQVHLGPPNYNCRQKREQWGRSSAGRAPALQAGGQEFDSPRLHQIAFWTLKTEQKRRKQSAGPWEMSHGKATSDQSESREKRINESRDGMFLSKAKRNQATKGIRRMPWRHEPMKDAISCEKPRGTANKYRSVGVRMGKPGSRYGLSPCKGREPGELKHLSSRRKRNQTRCPQ